MVKHRGDLSEGVKPKRKSKRVAALVTFAGLRFGGRHHTEVRFVRFRGSTLQSWRADWTYPTLEHVADSSPPCEVKLSFTTSMSKLSYEFPFKSDAHPEAVKALIE